ncbi:MAG: hypothetical protein LBO77_07040 [Desulfovibrio sp.]|nr:hypothetical protein [Desulfovibrio sp.]
MPVEAFRQLQVFFAQRRFEHELIHAQIENSRITHIVEHRLVVTVVLKRHAPIVYRHRNIFRQGQRLESAVHLLRVARVLNQRLRHFHQIAPPHGIGRQSRVKPIIRGPRFIRLAFVLIRANKRVRGLPLQPADPELRAIVGFAGRRSFPGRRVILQLKQFFVEHRGVSKTAGVQQVFNERFRDPGHNIVRAGRLRPAQF